MTEEITEERESLLLNSYVLLNLQLNFLNI